MHSEWAHVVLWVNQIYPFIVKGLHGDAFGHVPELDVDVVDRLVLREPSLLLFEF